MHHNQSKLLFPFIYSRSIYFISAAFSQSVTTFHLLQQNSTMEKYLIEISFFLFRLVEMFEICSRTSVMATTYCHCSKCSRAKYWYVLFSKLFSPVSWNLTNFSMRVYEYLFHSQCMNQKEPCVLSFNIQKHQTLGTFINDVPHFLAIFDLPTYLPWPTL